MGKRQIDWTSAALLLPAGGLIMALLGAPIAGATSALFWEKIVGGSTESASAARIEAAIFIRDHYEGDLPARSDSPAESECQMEAEAREIVGATDKIDLSLQILNSAVRKEQYRREQSAADDATRNALMKLPYPVLGALEGCLRGSVLAGWCEYEVKRLSKTARQSAASIIARQHIIDRVEMQKVWCKLAAAYRPSVRQ